MPEEYFDILDEQGNETGEKRSRVEAHSKGLWHRTVHVYLFRKIDHEIEFLVHLRSKQKDLCPNCWDTRFGGHLKAGEKMQDAAQSELREEIGLHFKLPDLIIGGTYKRNKFPNCEFSTVYYYNFENELSSLKFNDGEIQEVKWMRSDDIVQSIQKTPTDWASTIAEFILVLDFLKNKLKK